MVKNKLALKKKKPARLAGVTVNLADGGWIVEKHYRWDPDAEQPREEPRVYTDGDDVLAAIADMCGIKRA